MNSYSVAEAKNQLSELIDRSLRGEGIVITRHGHPVVQLRSLVQTANPVSKAELDWLVAHRVGKAPTLGDAAILLSVIRDEEER